MKMRRIADALPISSVHSSVHLFPTSILLIRGFTGFRCFTLKKNGRVCLGIIPVLVKKITSLMGHTHFLSKKKAQSLDSSIHNGRRLELHTSTPGNEY
jgi:hypothetical protein